MLKFFAQVIVGLVTVSLLGCSSLNIPRPSVQAAAVMDVTTTALVLDQGGVELNPLGFAGTTIAKLYYLYYIRPTLNDSEAQHMDRTLSSAFTGAATNNLIQLIWAPTLVVSLSLGLAVGLSAYYTDLE